MDAEKIALILTSFVVLLLSLSVHESAHAWMALRMGDDTAKQLGRITLNPLAHIDPIGTIVMPLLMLITGIPLLGWAKPTPVEPRNFRNAELGELLVSGAGPASNLLLALIFTGGLFVAVRAGIPLSGGPIEFLKIGIILNVSLAVFNMIPLPPLDGAWVLSSLLPRGMSDAYQRAMRPAGSMILLLLVMTGVLGRVMSPFIDVILKILSNLVS